MSDIKKILIAEDEVANAKTYLEFFDGKPFKIHHVVNGEQAVRLAKSDPPDLIIMDWNMPVMDGIEATKKLQEEGVTKEIPIIISTGIMTDSKDLKEALDSGAYDYIRKPFDPLELTARINSALTLSDSYKHIKSLLDLLQTEYDRRGRELSMAMSFKQNTAQYFDEIQRDLKELINVSQDSTKVLMKEMVKKVKTFSNVDKTWDEFKVYFENVNPRFLDKLEEGYPNLTIYEKRLCVYVKMGMSNKEISQINNISPDSVKTSLKRLKKKMNLPQDITFRDFIAEH